MNVLSLFSGAGGMDRGLESAGMSIVGLCELDPHAQSILRHHWPDTPLHDDVTTLDTEEWRGRVDLVAGGSPCQDLSVAGRRGGLDGARSGLFWHQCRIADSVAAPWVLWENVAGALSSNDGADFAAVLWGLTGALPRVPDGWWRTAGVVVGPKRTAVWRLLDARWFGVAQRRRRVFIVAGPRGECGPEVLLEPEGVRGDPEPSREAGSAVAAITARGVGTCGADGNQAQAGHLIPDHTGTITANWSKGPGNTQVEEGCVIPVAVSENQRGEVLLTSYSRQITTGGGKPGQGYAAALVDAIGVGVEDAEAEAGPVQDLRLLRDALGAEAFQEWAARGLPGVRAEEVLRSAVHGCGLRDAPEDGQSVVDDGALSREEDMPARAVSGLRELGAYRRSPQGRELAEQLAEQLGATLPALPPEGTPLAVRRLTPLEAERLMGWPDDSTRYGVTVDGTVVELADSHRYRACGNGVVSPVAEWIGRRIVAAAAAHWEAA